MSQPKNSVYSCIFTSSVNLELERKVELGIVGEMLKENVTVEQMEEMVTFLRGAKILGMPSQLINLITLSLVLVKGEYITQKQKQ